MPPPPHVTGPGVPGIVPRQGRPAPSTASLLISRRARREAAVAHAQDRRVALVENVLAGLQTAGNTLAAALCVVAWAWLTSRPPGDAPVATSVATDGMAASLAASVSGPALATIMIATCLLMAPAVNPFYEAPANRRLLHGITTSTFAILAVTTFVLLARMPS